MKKLNYFIPAILLLLCALTLTAVEEATSTLEEQKEVEVTVYNSNLGLVKDVREITLEEGEVSLRFMDVASQINTRSVHIKSKNYPNRLQILEQNYEYDLINHYKLMNKYVGKKIKLVTQNYYTDETEIVEAELLSNNDNQPVYRIDGEIYLGHTGRVILPEIPENLIARPTLIYLLQNGTGREHEVQVSYMTSNINWSADYVMVLSDDDKSCDINGWVTIDNRSGATYNNAKLKLIAGDVHTVDQYAPQMMKYSMMEAEGVSRSQPQFQEQEFFEYHIYTLTRPSTIKNNQEKQIQLLEATEVPVNKELIVYGSQAYFVQKYQEKIPKQDVNVYISFDNSDENNMGMPLPKGIIRIYKPDHQKTLQFIGEDQIDHTPKDEEIKVKVGKAFDVVCERTQTDYETIGYYTYETAWEIKVRNHKKEPAEVTLVEPLYADWTMLQNSHKYTQVDAHTIRFDVDVEPDEEVTITYRVRVTW